MYCPFLWEPGWIPEGGAAGLLPRRRRADERAIDVGLEGAGLRRPPRAVPSRGARRGPAAAYVALTRARHQAVIWWAGSWRCNGFPARAAAVRARRRRKHQPGGVGPAERRGGVRKFEELAGVARGAIAVECSVLGVAVSWGGSPPAAHELAAASFDRRLDLRWRRTSYSDITAAAHELVVGRSPSSDGLSDEPFGGRRTRCRVRRAAARQDAGRRARRHVRSPRARGDRLRGR